MTAVLVNGTIFRKPEQRISKAGKPFWTATIKAKDDDVLPWWKIIVFSESAGGELLRLGDGDALSVQGALRVETYEKDGATKFSLTCIADTVLALRQPPKQREKKPTPDRSSPPSPWRFSDDRFGDDMPF
jgi:single-stranded DNA-binding protein